MYAGTSDADENAQIPRGPAGTFGVAVDAVFVVIFSEQGAEDGLVFFLRFLRFFFVGWRHSVSAVRVNINYLSNKININICYFIYNEALLIAQL